MEAPRSSSTSSSDWGFALRSLVVALLLLGAYEAAIRGGLVAPAAAGLSQWQTNALWLERFVDSPRPAPRAALVGSSLATHLDSSRVDEDCYNLAQAAGCSLTGLEVILRSGKTPHYVLVEVGDTLSRPADGALIDQLFSPRRCWLRDHLLGTREEYRPATIVVRRILTLLGRVRRSEAGRAAVPAGQAAPRAPGQDGAAAAGLCASDADAIRRGALKLRRLSAQLQERGCTVLLFAMPRGAEVETSPAAQQVRDLLAEELPADQFAWLPPPPTREWATTDGSHLTAAEGAVMSDHLRRCLDERERAGGP